MYQAYSDNLRKAVAGVLSSDEYGDKYFDLQAQLLSNVSRFAAYKAYHLTEQLKRQRDKWPDDDDYKKVAKAVINTFNRYQAAEYNTAISRTRTAKQWIDFTSDPVSNELYPNLKWLPSRSANPREEHIPFYNLVLPKNDPFWLQNQPGNLWNCKCDWEETDEPANTNDLTPDELDEYRSDGGGIHANGLDGNPAETGEVFTDECTYFKKANTDKVENFWKPIETRYGEYLDLKRDSNYIEQRFNWNNGGLGATHIDHNFNENTGDYEKIVQHLGVENGHSVILCAEKGKAIGENYKEGFWDGETFEMGSSLGTGKNNIKGILNHCKTKEASVAVIYFPKKELYSYGRLLRGILMYNGQTEYRFKKIIYIVDNTIYEYK